MNSVRTLSIEAGVSLAVPESDLGAAAGSGPNRA